MPRKSWLQGHMRRYLQALRAPLLVRRQEIIKDVHELDRMLQRLDAARINHIKED